MVSISVCMIVKNEERVLARCLDSLAGLYEELIIVDTGSTDSTKEIAGRYTDKVYDFEWIGDFSAARNYAFSKASCDYIYSADADEVLDKENHTRFLQLKSVLDSRIEIVQMYYDNQLEHGTVYNFNKEYRPKLYKRLREFTWEEPVHEAVRLTPVVFDSDIAICHKPESNHAKRDFTYYIKELEKKGQLSGRLYSMYARELFVSGDITDFQAAEPYFKERLYGRELSEDARREAECILIKCARLLEKEREFFTLALHHVADGCGSAEVCYELGQFYQEQQLYEEASIWFLNAAFETESILNIHYSNDFPLLCLAECADCLGDVEEAKHYRRLAEEFQLPEGEDLL